MIYLKRELNQNQVSSSIEPLLNEFDSPEDFETKSGSLLPLPNKLNIPSRILIRKHYRSLLNLLSLGILAIVIGFYIRSSFHPQPSYVILSRQMYHSVLLKSIDQSFPRSLKDSLTSGLNDSLSMDLNQNYDPQVRLSSNNLSRTLWQTDYLQPTDQEYLSLKKSWIEAGVTETRFLDDSGAEQMIRQSLGDSEMEKVYLELPRPVLKADMLRYSALLKEGGIYR